MYLLFLWNLNIHDRYHKIKIVFCKIFNTVRSVHLFTHVEVNDGFILIML